MDNHHCNFIKKGDLRACGVLVALNTQCGTHAPIKARLPVHTVGTCEFVIGAVLDEHWCTAQPVVGDRLCALHVARREREDRLRAARNAAEQEANRAHIALDVEMAGLRIPIVIVPAAAPPVEVGEIQRLAADRQNVHTGPVVKQTNAGEEKLLAVKTNGYPVGLQVLRHFASRRGSMMGFMRVANDVERWYSMPTCRQMGDRLYGRLLEGLWVLIEQQPVAERAELKTRLWEEATESVGMCCEGHIARLVNVMSGFDETFQPRVSVGEAIQTKMAQIAGMGLSAAEKVAQARAFLTELAVSVEDQTPWLEALE